MSEKGNEKSISVSASSLVIRSDVAPAENYGDYRPYLRKDFFFSCAYCSMSESEAMGLRMTIDHYEPRSARPDLEREYKNLMYACDECNMRKGDRYPPEEARNDGHRFFRPDHDYRHQHFVLSGIRLVSNTAVGEYSIEALDLNRSTLRRLRELRRRLTQCDIHVSEGIAALRNFPIDQLPPALRGRALSSIRAAEDYQIKMQDEVDQLLREHALSPILDEPSDNLSHQRDRSERLKAMEALHPGVWRGRQVGQN